MHAGPVVPNFHVADRTLVEESIANVSRYEDVKVAEMFARTDEVPPARILIADDEPNIANTLAKILEREGFETMAVYGGEAAMEAAELFQPDVLLTDLMMPGVDGLTVAALLRRRFPKCRVVLFTGYIYMRDQLELRSRYHPSYLLLGKPMHPSDLVTALRRWMR